MSDLMFSQIATKTNLEPVKHLNLALNLVEERYQPQDWASLHSSIAAFYMGIGFRQTRVIPIKRAERHFQLALRYKTKEAAPDKYAHIHHYMGRAKGFIAYKNEDIETFSEAINHINIALEFYREDNDPFQWVHCMIDIGHIYFNLFKHSKKLSDIENSVKFYDRSTKRMNLLNEFTKMNAIKIHGFSLIVLGDVIKDKHIVFRGMTKLREVREYYKNDEEVMRAMTHIEEAAQEFLRR